MQGGFELGSVIFLDITIRSQQNRTSFALSYLIMELCQCAKVIFSNKKDFEYTSISTLYITRNEFIDEVRKKKAQETISSIGD